MTTTDSTAPTDPRAPADTFETELDELSQLRALVSDLKKRTEAAETLLADQSPVLAALHAATQACGYGVNIAHVWQRMLAAQTDGATEADLRASVSDIGPLVHTLASQLDAYLGERDEAAQLIAEAGKERDAAYHERAHLAAAFARLYPSHLAHDPNSPGWPVICIHSPADQLAWHISPRDLRLFDGIDTAENDWDGHSTELKYQRLALIGRNATSTQDTPSQPSDR